MKNVSCWREPKATTATDRRLRGCVHGLLVTTSGQKKIDDISTVWMSIQRMVAVRQEHLLQPQRPPSTSASLLAVRLELQRLSMPGRCQQLDTNVDEEVSQLLCRAPSPQLPQPAVQHRTKRRAAGPGKRDIAFIRDQAVSASWAEQGAGRDKSLLCLQTSDFKRPCLDFDKMQASLSFTPLNQASHWHDKGFAPFHAVWRAIE